MATAAAVTSVFFVLLAILLVKEALVGSFHGLWLPAANYSVHTVRALLYSSLDAFWMPEQQAKNEHAQSFQTYGILQTDED